LLGRFFCRLCVSIRALARRATLVAAFPPDAALHVSIRALARRATSAAPSRRFAMGFQSAPSHGGRHLKLAQALEDLKFQSAPSHGGRREKLWRKNKKKSFNPRPRTEGDSQCPSETDRHCPFQSAPSHGGRLRGPKTGRLYPAVSIRALARRATLLPLILCFSL